MTMKEVTVSSEGEFVDAKLAVFGV